MQLFYHHLGYGPHFLPSHTALWHSFPGPTLPYKPPETGIWNHAYGKWQTHNILINLASRVSIISSLFKGLSWKEIPLRKLTSSNLSGSATISMPSEPAPFLKTNTLLRDCSIIFLWKVSLCIIKYCHQVVHLIMTLIFCCCNKSIPKFLLGTFLFTIHQMICEQELLKTLLIKHVLSYGVILAPFYC